MIYWLRITLLTLAFSAQSANAGIVVIVNPANPVTDFDKRQLIDLYMGRNLYFPDGKLAIRLDQPPTSQIRRDFYQNLVGMSVAEVKAYWARLLFTGRATPPLETDNSEQIIDAVLKNETAIGYIQDDEVTDSVKVVGHVE